MLLKCSFLTSSLLQLPEMPPAILSLEVPQEQVVRGISGCRGRGELPEKVVFCECASLCLWKYSAESKLLFSLKTFENFIQSIFSGKKDSVRWIKTFILVFSH